ncbi:hypothetical protein IX329_001015 [Fusobacterium necrophorum]|nr:hypothetical protein [Fusobacterium necrophorum]MBR8733441.1 hypothetical protein [Fusobacterium necrophorum]MBR8789618.1 hypothetical protein [Fusobacterium necrophorum]MCF0163441.1 hypothetical protein [Fusobacterium necrophorum]
MLEKHNQKILLEIKRYMNQEEYSNPYSKNYIKKRAENNILYEREEEHFSINLSTGMFEGEILVKEDEYLFQGNLKNNQLERTQKIYLEKEQKRILYCEFDVEKGKVKNIKKISKQALRGKEENNR